MKLGRQQSVQGGTNWPAPTRPHGRRPGAGLAVLVSARIGRESAIEMTSFFSVCTLTVHHHCISLIYQRLTDNAVFLVSALKKVDLAREIVSRSYYFKQFMTLSMTACI